MVYDVESVLAGLKVPTIRRSDAEIRAVCPAHYENTGKKDSVGDWSINVDTGQHHCFSCGFGGDNVITLVAYVAGIDIWEASKWARQFGLADLEPISYEDAGYIKQKAKRREAVKPETISDSHLAIFSEVPDRLLESRDLDRESADLYGVAWSREDKAWVLPIRMPDGQLLGYQLRRKGWERNRPKSVRKSHTLFGAHLGEVHWGGVQTAILVESPLDAVRLHSVGYDGALASFGAMVSHRQLEHLVEDYDHLLLALDNDAAGWAMADKIWARYKQRIHLSFLSYDHTTEKDVGDMTDKEIDQAIENAKPLPIRARKKGKRG